jgi:eukaryotic-like serine/threonine-protein kinase
VSDPTPTAIPILTTLQIYSGHTDIVHAVAWSSDAKFIASGSYDQTVQVWDSTKGARASEFNGLNRIISSVSWSPVASRLAASGLDSDEVQILDPGTGISTGLPYHLHSNFVYAVAWSPDGTRIATAGGGGTGSSVQVWDVTKNSIVASFNGHTGGVFTVAWSPDGQFIASGGGDKTVRIWSIATQQEVRVYQEHEGAVNTIAWCPKNSGILASGSQDKTVTVFTEEERIS